MIRKWVTRLNLKDATPPGKDLASGLSRTPEERIAAVEFPRKIGMDRQPDFRELLELFSGQHVEFLIAGGYALAFRGVGSPPSILRDFDDTIVFLVALAAFCSRSLWLWWIRPTFKSNA